MNSESARNQNVREIGGDFGDAGIPNSREYLASSDVPAAVADSPSIIQPHRESG